MIITDSHGIKNEFTIILLWHYVHKLPSAIASPRSGMTGYSS